MDNAALTIVLVIFSIIIFVGMVMMAIFVTSDDFKDFMEEDHEKVVETPTVDVDVTTQNVSEAIVSKLSWKRKTINSVLEAVGVDTSKDDDEYEARAMMHATVKMVTIILIVLGVLIAAITIVTYLNQQFHKR